MLAYENYRGLSAEILDGDQHTAKRHDHAAYADGHIALYDLHFRSQRAAQRLKAGAHRLKIGLGCHGIAQSFVQGHGMGSRLRFWNARGLESFQVSQPVKSDGGHKILCNIARYARIAKTVASVNHGGLEYLAKPLSEWSGY